MQAKQLKINFNNEIKRSALPLKYEDLVGVITICFSINPKTTQFEINYKDDEDDKVRISNQFDLDQALIFLEKQGLNLLKVFVDVKNDFSMISEIPVQIEAQKIEDINILNNLEQELTEKKIKEDYEIVNKEDVEELSKIEAPKQKEMTNEELSVILTDAVSKEIEGMKDAIVKKLLKKTEEIKSGKKPEKKVEKKEEKPKKPAKKPAPKKPAKKEEKPKEKKPEKKEEKKEQVVHPKIACDGCDVFPVTGIRYKCTVCYDFDYCEKCEEKNKTTHLHPFLKIRTPEQAPHEIFCTLPDGKVPDHAPKPRKCFGGAFHPVKKMFKDMFTSKFENQEAFNNEFHNKLQNFQDGMTKFGKKCSDVAGEYGKKAVDFGGEYGKKAVDFGGEYGKKCVDLGEEYGKKCGNFVNKESTNIWEHVGENMKKFFNMFKKEEVKDINQYPTEDKEVEKVEVKKSEETAQPSVEKVDDIVITNEPEVKKDETVVEVVVEEPKKEEKQEEKQEVEDGHKLILQELKSMYDLSAFSDEDILSAIVKTKGNPDDVFLYLF